MKFRSSFKYLRIVVLVLVLSVFYCCINLRVEKSTDETLSKPQFKTVFNGSEMTKIVYQLKPITKPTVLFLSLIAGIDSFGQSRSFLNYLEIINLQCIAGNNDYTLGLLVSSRALFNLVTSLVESLNPPNFSRITIILDHRSPTERTHDHNKQRERRRFIAALRNTLVYSSMRNENYLLWIDSDIIKIPSELLNTMIKSGHDIITPACKSVGYVDYDGNAWKGQRTRPSPSQIEQMDKTGESNFIPAGVDGKNKHVSELHGPERFVEIDSVGGTVLFTKAELFRQGVSFPPYYVVGADWDRLEGWDGIETEGLCYVAKAVGYKCWAMPNDFVDHA